MIERNSVGELYEKAANELGSDALLSTTIVIMDRSTTPVRVLVHPWAGSLILATKDYYFPLD